MYSFLLAKIGAYLWLAQGVMFGCFTAGIGLFLLRQRRNKPHLFQWSDLATLLDLWTIEFSNTTKTISVKFYRGYVDKLIANSGAGLPWNANYFLARVLLVSLISLVFSFLLGTLFLGLPISLAIAVTAVSAFLVHVRFYDLGAKRQKSCNRDLPFILDYVTLTMGAGLDFNQSVDIVTKNAPDSPLLDEFKRYMKNISLGRSRSDALNEMRARLDNSNVTNFVLTLNQGIDLGVDVAQTIGSISESMQQKRFQRAEEAAGKISVRMMIPMMMFIMPAVMIVLLGPLLLSYMQG